MKIAIEIPDEYAKPFLEELKMTLRIIDIDLEDKKKTQKTHEFVMMPCGIKTVEIKNGKS